MESGHRLPGEGGSLPWSRRRAFRARWLPGPAPSGGPSARPGGIPQTPGWPDPFPATVPVAGSGPPPGCGCFRPLLTCPVPPSSGWKGNPGGTGRPVRAPGGLQGPAGLPGPSCAHGPPCPWAGPSQGHGTRSGLSTRSGLTGAGIRRPRPRAAAGKGARKAPAARLRRRGCTRLTRGETVFPPRCHAGPGSARRGLFAGGSAPRGHADVLDRRGRRDIKCLTYPEEEQGANPWRTRRCKGGRARGLGPCPGHWALRRAWEGSRAPG